MNNDRKSAYNALHYPVRGVYPQSGVIPRPTLFDYKTRTDLEVIDALGGDSAAVVGGRVANFDTSSEMTITKATGENLYPNHVGLYAKREDLQAVVRSTIEQQIYNLDVIDLGYVIWFDSSLATTMTFRLAGTIGQTNTIHWGDGSVTNITYTSSTSGTTYSHTYTASTGKYYVIIEKNNYSYLEINTQKIEGSVTNFNPSYQLYLNNLPLLTGVVTNFNPSYQLYLSNLPLLTGVVTNFNPSYYLFLSNLPLLTGDVSNFNPSNRLYLSVLPLITCNFPLIFTTLKDISIISCNLSQANVDKYLARCVSQSQTNGILNLGGTGNAAPSAQGLTDKATLVFKRLDSNNKHLKR